MTTPSSALPPANWYPDPQTPGQLRYWDGQRWTQHVHPVQQPAQGVGGFAPTGGAAAQAGGGYAPAGGNAQAGGGYAPAGGAAQAGGGYAPAGGNAQAGGGYAPAGGGYAPNEGAAQAGTGSPTLEGVLSGAGGAPYQPAQSSMPQAAGPATGGTFLPAGAASRTAAPGGAPASGGGPAGIASFQPGAAAGTPGSLRVPVPRDFEDDDDEGMGNSRPPQTLFAFVFGTAALAATALGLYHPGTGLDDFFPYVGAGLGFLSVLFGLVGRRQTSGGLLRGTVESWFGIGAGFLSIALSAYEYMYPNEILGLFKDALGG